MMSDDTPANAPRLRNLDRTRPIHVSLPGTLYDRLTDTAARLGVSRSMLAHAAIDRGLKAATDHLRVKARRNSADTTEADA